MSNQKVNLLKPLNVLVIIDNEQSHGQEKLSKEYCDHLFSAIQNFLTFFLSQKFTIYLTSVEELNRRAWFNTTKLLLVVHSKQIDDPSYLNQSKNTVIKEFYTKTHNVIIIDRYLLSPSTDLQNFTLNTDLLKSKLQQKLGTEIVYENFQVPELTAHYVYSHDINLSKKLFDYLDKELKLEAKISQNLGELDLNFDIKRYLAHLSSNNQLGRNLIVSNVTKSTQPIAEHAPLIDGLIVIANQQAEGKGRGQNQWLSPAGSVNFTYGLSVPMNSILFKSLPFFQHMNALAILLGIKKFANMDKLDLKIKWPNDIYYKSKHKVVGILTNSQFEGNCAKFFIGTGINLSNDRPTYSLKNIFEEELKDTEFTLRREELIAEILNQVNYLIKLINSQGKEKIVDLYYENWMLTDKIIQLDNGKQAHILGLDEDGFLRVNLVDDGEIVSLLPDGNRWDILENLLINPSSS